MIANNHEDRWTKLVSNWNPAMSTKQKRVPGNKEVRQKVGRRPQHLHTTRWSQQGQQQPHEPHDLAHHGGRQLEMGVLWKATS